ncbi:MAG: hypothetical protein MI746_08860 [Pseudomonadales bacterium]|nr:hypothetical protein [Pseudomonadales bacterium]
MSSFHSWRLLVIAAAVVLIGCSEQESTPGTVAQIDNGSATRDTAKGLDYEFYRDSIEPIFLRHRGGFVGSDTSCVACHTTQANAPLGLQPLTEENGNVFWTEAQSRQNFENVAMLVNPSNPESSRLLLAPLAPAAGGERHSGGIFWDTNQHAEYRVVAEWIATGNSSATADPIVDVDFEFFRSCVQPIFVNPIDNAMPCIECHSGEFAVPPPENSYWTEEQSRQAFEDLLYLIDPGRPDSSRFLHKPLHPNAGGDLMHNGGRRWFSADDPERMALADWVRGDATGDQCPPALQYEYPPRS